MVRGACTLKYRIAKTTQSEFPHIDDGSGAAFSECEKYRYKLWRVWDMLRPRILFIMLNPSTADEVKADPSVRRCIGYAQAWDYGGLYVGNLFAWRATDPNDLRAALEPEGAENDDALLEMADKSDLVVAAWGNHGAHRRRAKKFCRNFVLRSNMPLHCLDVTKSGQPVHPLYQRKDLKPIPYELGW